MLKPIAATLALIAFCAAPAVADVMAKSGRTASGKMNISSSARLAKGTYKGQWTVTRNRGLYARAAQPGFTQLQASAHVGPGVCRFQPLQRAAATAC